MTSAQTMGLCAFLLIVHEFIPLTKAENQVIWLKVPLTPKIFLSRQKSPFCSDHIGEKIMVVRFFLDFLWIFKIRKIRATVVHGRVTRRMSRVGLWRQPGKAFRLERWYRGWRDCRSEVTEGLFRGKHLLQCLACVSLQIAVMWWIFLNVYRKHRRISRTHR